MITHSHLLFLSASSSWFISDTGEGHHHSFTSFVDLWQEIQNIKSLYEIIRSVSPTKFDDIVKPSNYLTDIHKELKDLYVSGFNTSKDQLEDGIQKLNETMFYYTDSFTRYKIKEGIKHSLRTISVNVIIDDDVTISNMEFHPISKDRMYEINFLQKGNKTLHLSIMNTTSERIYFFIKSSHMSVFAKDNIFIGSGIQVNPQSNVNPLPIIIDNCTFQGHMSYSAVAIIKTRNVFVTNSRFQNLLCDLVLAVVICHGSQLELRNVSVYGCHCLPDTISIHHCNITASYVRVKNNRNYKQYYDGKLFWTVKSVLHIDHSIFEWNFNYILMGFQFSFVNISSCTFINNNVTTVIGASGLFTSSYFYGFTTIKNTVFANNTIRDIGDYAGGIIDSCRKKVYLVNVTLAHNNGKIVTCDSSVIEMMSCEFTINIKTDVKCEHCNVIMTNSVFQRNHGRFFRLLRNSNLTATKSYFSDNLNPDGIFYNFISPLSYMDISFCTFKGNHGGIFLVLSQIKFVSISNCSFHNNSAVHGSIAMVGYSETFTSPIDISFCTFKRNYAGNGGIMSVGSNNFVSISNCKFYNNSAITGGIATLIIKNSTVFGNSASGDGGTLSLSEQSTLTIENSVFNNNGASGNAGVVLLADPGTLTIENSMFNNNGASGNAGVVLLADHGTLTIENSKFNNNSASGNAGVVLLADHGTLTIENSMFNNNSASGNAGVVLLADHGTSTIENSKFNNSSASGDAGAVLLTDHSTLLIENTLSSTTHAE